MSMIRQTTRFRRFALPAALVMILILVSSTAYYRGATVDAALAPNIVASTITGAVDANNTGHEPFWNQITGMQIPLTATNDYGGATKSVTVKMANNGTHILVYATWGDPTSSRTKNDVVEQDAYPALFYANASFYYEDRIVIWWSLSQNPGPPPCMQKSAYGHGEGESLAGTGNLWHWKGARTDTLGGSYGKLKFASGPNKGQLITPPHSFAANEFINTTGHYQLGWDQYPTATAPGNFTVGFAENNIPYNTYVVYAHGVYDPVSHTYTWEAARSLHTTPALHMVQFNSGASYNFAVAIFDGGPIPIPAAVAHPAGWSYYGENEETKSISAWNTMAVGPAPVGGQSVTTVVGPTATSTLTNTATATVTSNVTTTVTNNELSTIAYVGAIGTLVVGLIAGIVAGSGRLARKG